VPDRPAHRAKIVAALEAGRLAPAKALLLTGPRPHRPDRRRSEVSRPATRVAGGRFRPPHAVVVATTDPDAVRERFAGLPRSSRSSKRDVGLTLEERRSSS
jgi:hypothetical protein